MTSLQRYTVTVRRFDPSDPDGGETFELPVDSPDAEHAVSAAMSNAVAFTPKVDDDGTLAPVAFQATAVGPR